jgi:hypothetical protein
MKEYAVRNFDYNGFFGSISEGYVKYRATFKHWTSDPGVAMCKCTDGLERLIPTFALEGFNVKDYRKQTYENGKTMFGMPCKS